MKILAQLAVQSVRLCRRVPVVRPARQGRRAVVAACLLASTAAVQALTPLDHSSYTSVVYTPSGFNVYGSGWAVLGGAVGTAISAVPEPSALVLMLAGATAVSLRVRRSRAGAMDRTRLDETPIGSRTITFATDCRPGTAPEETS